MKIFFPTLALLFLTESSFAQEPADLEYVKIFQLLFPRRNNDWLMPQADSAKRAYNYSLMQREYYQKRYMVNDVPKRDTLFLTSEEKATIARNIALQDKNKWTAKRMKQVGLSEFKLVPREQLHQSATREHDVYTIMEPVFFRNNTFCFSYYADVCSGMCGQETLLILEKVNGKWEYWEEIYTIYD